LKDYAGSRYRFWWSRRKHKRQKEHYRYNWADIPPPDQDPGVYRKLALTYDHLEDFSGENRVNINEPFRSPLIQFVLSAITGFGAPDYPAELQNSINSKLDEYLKQE
jgi:hypothetical protein